MKEIKDYFKLILKFLLYLSFLFVLPLFLYITWKIAYQKALKDISYKSERIVYNDKYERKNKGVVIAKKNKGVIAK